jgi:NAD dependent epimerase/dehydratase
MSAVTAGFAWTGRRVVVTGAGGFIGSHLAERLVELGAEVTAFVHYKAMGAAGWLEHSRHRSALCLVAGDVRDRDSLDAACDGADTVFHLAALIGIPWSYTAPASYLATNIEGSLNLFQAARRAGVRRVVHTSTSEVYGTARYVPMDEAHPLTGQSPYSASKIGADKMAEAFHLSFGLPVATIRPFNAYGPRQSARAVIPTIIDQALNGNEIRLGNLTATRDFNYVGDTVEGFLAVAAADAALGQVVNIGTGSEISVEGVVREVLRVIGKDLPVVQEQKRLRPENSEVDRLCAGNKLARELTGWTPRVSITEGLERTIAWVRHNPTLLQAANYVV